MNSKELSPSLAIKLIEREIEQCWNEYNRINAIEWVSYQDRVDKNKFLEEPLRRIRNLNFDLDILKYAHGL